MYREQEFRQAVDGSPDDDSLRLAFADWLEDRGDPRAVEVRLRLAQIGRIRTKLADLRAADLARRTFAAHVHQYRLEPTLRAAQIRELEARHDFICPEEYFDFLVRIGGSGAGPFYGIIPLAKSVAGVGTADFPVDQAVEREDPALPQCGLGYEMPYDAPGCLAICEQGCGTETVLVVRLPLGHGLDDRWRRGQSVVSRAEVVPGVVRVLAGREPGIRTASNGAVEPLPLAC